MPSLKHTHQYIRVPGSKIQFKCAYPNCTHVWSRRFIIGRLSVCNGCGNEFILDEYALRRSQPKCKNCRSVRRDEITGSDLDLMQSQERERLKNSFQSLEILEKLGD